MTFAVTKASRAFLVLSIALFALTACSESNSAPTDSVPLYVAEAIEWGACTGDDAPQEPFECGSVDVPLDYENANSQKIELALIRIPATETKRGVILTNPGGPGASGVDFITSAGQDIVLQLDLYGYDLIGFDPRGVDRSGGIRCLSDEVMDKYLYVDATPDNEAEQKLYDESEDLFEKGCEEKYGDDIDMYSTANIAHDMDVIRGAIDVDQISYIGISYGTYLGGVYATLYPNRIESMFLDAPFDPQGDSVEEQYLTQIGGFEEAFNSWVKWCEEEDSCAFQSNDVGKRWDDLLDRVDTESVMTDDQREVNSAVMEEATIQALYARSFWPILATALTELERGNGAEVLRIADQSKGRNEDGTFNTIEQSFSVINCASGFRRDNPDDPEELVKKLNEVAPRFSKDFEADDFEGSSCDGLTEDAPLIEIAYKGSAPIVVVGGENDPATPIRWAEEMVVNLGSNARLVRFEGEGHSQLTASSCVDRIAFELFSSAATLPEINTVCLPDEPIERPDWFVDLPPVSDDEIVLDSAVMSTLVGLPETRFYSEYRATQADASSLFKDYSSQLTRMGFVPIDPDADEAVENPQFFIRDSDSLVVWIFDGNTIEEVRAYAPNGPVPAGDVVMVLVYVPPENRR